MQTFRYFRSKTFFKGMLKLRVFLIGQPFPKQALVFTCLHLESFENTVGKGEIAHNENFLHFRRT